MKVISIDSYFIPPFIIFLGKCILAGWFNIYNKLDYIIRVLDSGYINNILAF